MRKHLMSLAAVGALVVAFQARAHGDWPPKHGGQMNQDGGEVAFELVAKGKQVTVYLEDHGQPIRTTTVARAALKATRSGKEWTAPLKPAGENRMTGRLPEHLRKGDDIVADVAFRDGSIAQGRLVFGVEVRPPTRSATGAAAQGNPR